MPILVIVESPTKAKTLTKILPKEYDIKASMGHIRDLPKSGLGVDVDHNFEPQYIVPEKAEKTVRELKKSAKEASKIILATDPDREGEAISWHLKHLLGEEKKTKSSKKAKSGDNTSTEDTRFGRVTFHELTKSAVLDAFEHLGEINLNLVNAQQARRVLDRLVGYKLSPLLWKKVRYGLSAGRVQSVAVKLIVEREREREKFKPEEYWSVNVLFVDNNGERPFMAELFEKNEKKLALPNAAVVEKIQNELKNDSFSISQIKKTERKKNPYPPLKTSTLQQSAANIFGFNAKKTMDAAQKLFEKGFITYHRTDSFNLSSQFIDAARTFASKEFGKDSIPETPNFYKTKQINAQEAHEAIRPTSISKLPLELKLTADETKVYTLIWKRALECQMEAAVYDQTTMHVRSQGGYGFKATGSIIKFAGWTSVDKFLNLAAEPEEEIVSTNNVEGAEVDDVVSSLSQLPIYTEGEDVTSSKVDTQQHFTQPPARYTDASLIKKMEELGVGRPSTYAPTIQTVQSRGYVKREGRSFIPTDVAYVVTDLLTEHFKEIIDYGFTAHMEEELDLIAEGEREWVPIIREFYKPFEKNVVLKDKQLSKTEVTNLGESDEKCPECGKVLIFKLGKYGKFLSCSGYPDCTFAKPIEQQKDEITSLVDDAMEKEADKDYGPCDKCKDGKLIVKNGRYGKFLACSNYPKCKNTKPLLNKIDMKCPKCSEGDVVVRFARRKRFFGCSKYPDCDWSSWKLPNTQ